MQYDHCCVWAEMVTRSALQGHEGCLHPVSSSQGSNYCLSLFDASRVRPIHHLTLRQFPERCKEKPISCWQGKIQRSKRRELEEIKVVGWMENKLTDIQWCACACVCVCVNITASVQLLMLPSAQLTAVRRFISTRKEVVQPLQQPTGLFKQLTAALEKKVLKVSDRLGYCKTLLYYYHVIYSFFYCTSTGFWEKRFTAKN